MASFRPCLALALASGVMPGKLRSCPCDLHHRYMLGGRLPARQASYRCRRAAYRLMSATMGREVVSDVEQCRASGWPLPAPAEHVPAEKQLRRQGVRPIASVDELAVPGVWESDEELDEFLADLYASRRAGMP